MKKILLLSALAVLFAACSKDDPESKTSTLDFESVPENQKAGPTAEGENLYGPDYWAFAGLPPFTPTNQYPLFHKYTDQATGISFGVPNDGKGFSGGGIAPSDFHDTQSHSYTNQCSVFFSQSGNGNGGHAGSKMFGIVYEAQGFGTPPALSFPVNEERTIESLWVANSTYTALTIERGNEYTNPLEETGGWFKVTIRGIRLSGASAGSVDFYLADFRTPQSPGLIREWTQISLAGLGDIHKLEFTFSGSDMGDYGLNTPSYCCIDDIRVIKETK